MLGYWGVKAKTNHFNFKNFFDPIIPLFHRSKIPFGAKPLSSKYIFMSSGRQPNKDLF